MRESIRRAQARKKMENIQKGKIKIKKKGETIVRLPFF